MLNNPPNVTTALNNGLGIPFIDVSYRLVANSSAAAAANAAIIQAAIIAAQSSVPNTVAITVPGVYYLNQVVMYSYTNLYIGAGVTIRKPANTTAPMFMNYGATQVTPTTDTDIGFYGSGTIDGNASNQVGLTAVAGAATNTFLYGIQGELAMIGVNNFTCEVRYPYNCNGFFVQWIGQNGRFANMLPNTARDFIHINGPSNHIAVENCSGYSSDAFIALNAYDWHRSGPTVGDITDVRITKCAYYGSNGLSGANRTSGMAVFLPGTRTTGYGQGTGNVKNVTVDGFNVDMTRGSVTPASDAFFLQQTLDTLQGSEYSGVGSISNVVIRNGYATVPNSNCSLVNLISSGLTADGQCTTTLRDVWFENVHADATVGTTGTNMVKANSIYNYWYVENLGFRNCQWTPVSGSGAQQFLNWATKTPADSIVIDGLVINSNTATSTLPAVLVNQYSAGNNAVINDLTMDRIKTAPGYQHASPWLYVAGTVTNFRSRGNYIVGSGAGPDTQGIWLNSTTAQLVNGVVSDGYFNGVKELVMVSSAVAAAINLIINNCTLNNVTHPVYLNAGVTADVSFRGCSINTGANIARLGSASGTLKVSFVDTQSSGTGASIITAAAAGAIQVRNSDRIQLPAGLTATNPPTPQNNDVVNFSATPSYTGSNVVSGTGAGLYMYRGTGTVGWLKLN